MPKDLTKKRKQDLGIFYTPPGVVGFIFDLLNIWKDKDAKKNHRWQYKKPKPHYPSVIDPACGEGIFLKRAVDSGFTTPKYIWGIDLDEKVKEKWKKITLLKSFGSKANLDFHFYHQDGLLPVPEKKVGHKKGGMNQYDAVVGNPPYGGIGINEITPELEKALFNYQIWKIKSQKDKKYSSENLGLFETSIPEVFKKKIQNFPIEILFLDRFIQLTKPGGWIAIIIPDGILTNSNSHYVREYLADRTKVEAIISLPRETFKNVGTSAKTSILFLKKLNKDERSKNPYSVFLASIKNINKDQFKAIVKSYEKIYNLGENHMDKSNLIQITNDQNKREAVMVRADRALKDLMDEKPTSRWDPEYWHPKYDKLFEKLNSSGYELRTLKELMLPGIEGITYGQVGQRIYDEKGKIQYLQVSNIQITGVDTVSKFALIKENSHNDPARSRLKELDLLLINGGVGSIGRSCVFVTKVGEFNISQDVDRIRFKNPHLSFYITVYLNSVYGKSQIERYTKGVSGQTKFGFDQVRSVIIPLIKDDVLKNIEKEYRTIAQYHDSAMKSKKKGDEKGYRENLETAEKMLKDLIKKTEEVIEGKREDVN